MPAEDLISDLNSEADFHSLSSNKSKRQQRNNKKLDLKLKNSSKQFVSNNDDDDDDDIKTPDIDTDRFQVNIIALLYLIYYL